LTDPNNKKPEGDNEPKNRFAKMKSQDVAIEALKLQEQVDSLKEELEKVKGERDEANVVISNDIRARKITELMKKTNYTVEDVDGWTIEELDAALKHVNMVKQKMIKPVGDLGSVSALSPQSEMDDIFAFGPEKKVK
jgi:hypothetical protein